MAGIQEEAVAGEPCGIVGIGDKETGIKHVYEIGSAHSTTGMTGFGLFHHGGSKDADIVRSPVKFFRVHILCFLFLD